MGRAISRRELLKQNVVTGAVLSAAPVIVFGRHRRPAPQSPKNVAQVDRSIIRKFASRLRGQALLPDDKRYTSAGEDWAGQMPLRPGLVVRCAATEDVVASVKFARDHDLPIAVRAGGHHLRSTEGGVLVNLSGMTKVSVDASSRIARADAGLLLGDLDRATQMSGLAAVLGECPSVGMSGYTLGGGLGRLMGRHGSACDNLLSAEIVTADGRVLRISANENPDLFWGVRGSGGNFGIVTSFEHRLHPVGRVMAGVLQYPMSQARAALRFFADYMKEAPDELDGLIEMGSILQYAPGIQVPTVVINVCCGGDLRTAEKTLRPLRAFGPPARDTVRPMLYVEAQGLGADVSGLLNHLTPKYVRFANSGFVTGLAEGAIDAIVDHFQSPPSASWALAFDHYLHGAICRVPEAEMAFNLRQRGYSFRLTVFQERPAPAETSAQQWVKSLHDALEPFSGGRMYLNYLSEQGEPGVRMAFGANYERLVALKKRYDPTNFFRLNPNIPPG
jgi:FAD/FMN-containing dehydrogenase